MLLLLPFYLEGTGSLKEAEVGRETYPSGTSNDVSEICFGESGEFFFPTVHIFALEKGLGMIHNYFSLFP